MRPDSKLYLSFDIWAEAEKENSDKTISIDILMPNGILLTLDQISCETSLVDLKEYAFEEAAKQPLFGALSSDHNNNYVFTCINSKTSELEELSEGQRRLCDIRPFLALLKLVEKKGDNEAKQLDAQIGLIIGKNLKEFDSLKNPEVNDFRYRMRLHCESVKNDRDSKTWLERMQYQYPCRVDANSQQLPTYLRAKIIDGQIKVKIKFDSTNCACQKLAIPIEMTPDQLINLALVNDQSTHDSVDYLLKMNGRLEYLLGNHQLIDYKCIQEFIANDECPYLVAVLKSNVHFEEECEYEAIFNDNFTRLRTNSIISLSGSSPRRKLPHISSWSITDKKFVLHIKSAIRVDIIEGSKVSIKIGLFHGGELLCNTQSTSKVIPNKSKDGEAVWDEDITFDVLICDIPRMTRLCFAMYASVKRSSKMVKIKNISKERIPLAWANTTVYDYKNVLKSGSFTLSMWNYDSECGMSHIEDLSSEQDLLYPLGTVGPNPSVELATCLTITFEKYIEGENPIMFPSLEDMIATANVDQNVDQSQIKALENNDQLTSERKSCSETLRRSRVASKQYLVQLKEICERDLLHEIYEQERELIWILRNDCKQILPHSLPKLLLSIKWSDRKKVAEIISLLQDWPKLEPSEKALELLDYAYPDSIVRSFAINCLREMSDEQISLYLLQLVQAIKCESYLHCDLVEFLLERSFSNLRIGHQLFWLLRSEMHIPCVSVRFGLILEAYCRGALDHMNVLCKQIEAVNKLKRVTEIVRGDNQSSGREKRLSLMHDVIGQNYYQKALLDVINPLDPTTMLGQVKIEKCKFMDSKMKPLWLVFANPDGEDAQDIYIIYKTGDDLRQDMLTLQMIRVMDQLWKSSGLDLRMSPYRCQSTAHKEGLIEVVLNANTIANIQKEKSSSASIAAFKKGSLFAWLKDHNPSEEELAKAIEQFTLSCAGYSVASYVLGIADRHNDNIMVRKNGQLFHIDFGHILGNYKEKFGIRRERVPFVLTNDFVYVITHGHHEKKSNHFATFQRVCEQAFLILRSNGPIIISLFALMLSTGIPQLSSVEDLDYLRDTLVLDMSEEEALKHFRLKFTEAIKNSWKTSLNWCAHNIAKDNK